MDSVKRFDCDLRLQYEVTTPSQFILAIQPARTAHQRIDDESVGYTGALFLREDTDAHTGTRRSCYAAEHGLFDIQYRGVVSVQPEWVPMDRALSGIGAAPALSSERAAGQTAAAALGSAMYEPLLPEAFRYLMPSRYCPSDRLVDFVVQQFDLATPPLLRAARIVDWVRSAIELAPGGEADSTVDPGAPIDSAMQVLRRGGGSAADLTHLTIALCRAANLPARYMTGLGAPAGDGRAPLRPYVEMLVDGRWLIADIGGRSGAQAPVRLATGPDAASTAICTVFGPARLVSVQASLRALDPQAPGAEAHGDGRGWVSTSGYNDLAVAGQTDIVAVQPAREAAVEMEMLAA